MIVERYSNGCNINWGAQSKVVSCATDILQKEGFGDISLPRLVSMVR